MLGSNFFFESSILGTQLSGPFGLVGAERNHLGEREMLVIQKTLKTYTAYFSFVYT